MIWVRHRIWRLWCLATHIDDSVVRTACRGSFETSEDYESSIEPSAELRCGSCERTRIVEVDKRRVEAGLAELARNAPACDCSTVPLRHLDEDGHLPRCNRPGAVTFEMLEEP